MSEDIKPLEFLDESPNTRDLLDVLPTEHQREKERRSKVLKALDEVDGFYSATWGSVGKKDNTDCIYQYASENQNLFYKSVNVILTELHAVYPIIANLIEQESRALKNIVESRNSYSDDEEEENVGWVRKIFGGRKKKNENKNIDTLYERSENQIDETKQFPRNWARWLEYHIQGVVSAGSDLINKGDLEAQKILLQPEYGFYNSYCKYALLLLFGENHRLILEKEKDLIARVTTRAYEDRERHSTQFRPENMSK